MMARHYRANAADGRRLAADSGFTLLECVAAIALLSAALVVSLELQVAASGQRRAAEQRQLAQCEVENLLERLTALPWSELESQRAAQFTLSERAGEALKQARLTIDVVEEPAAEGVRSKRIHVSLSWQARSGEPAAPVELVAWVFEPQDAPSEPAAEETP